MSTIFKYALANERGRQAFSAPRGAEIVRVAMQHSAITLWAIVDPANEHEARAVYVVGTGHPLPDFAYAGNYLGAVHDGPFVWHVFVEPRP